MAIKRRRRANAAFNMSSMTDLVFLLLIFFMLTSTLVNPNALRLLLPKSTNRVAEPASVAVSIDKDHNYYIDSGITPFSMLETKIVERLKDKEDACINIQAEKSVPIEHIVRVMNIAKDHGYKVILATAPE